MFQLSAIPPPGLRQIPSHQSSRPAPPRRSDGRAGSKKFRLPERKINGSDSFRQLAKLTEETGELAADISKGRKRGKIADSIGDCVVVLTILAAQNGLKIEDCIAQAYDEIKERRGVMQDGVFVKEEDMQ